MGLKTTRHLGHGGLICERGKDNSGNLFALSFLWKYENPLTHRRKSKYDADQDGHTGAPESSEYSEGEVHKLSLGESGSDLGRDGGGFQRRSHTDAWVIKA